MSLSKTKKKTTDWKQCVSPNTRKPGKWKVSGKMFIILDEDLRAFLAHEQEKTQKSVNAIVNAMIRFARGAK